MKKHIWIVSIIILSTLMLGNVVLSVSAHSGRTDSRGGHTNRSTGEYHYHHGYSAHDHHDMDGDGIADCPYDFRDNADHDNVRSTSSTEPTSDIYKTLEIKKDYSDLKLILTIVAMLAVICIAWYCILF